MNKTILFALASLLVLSACTAVTEEAPSETVASGGNAVEMSVAVEDVDAELEAHLQMREDMKNRRDAETKWEAGLLQLEEDWSASLQRGDAELAPDLSEFIGTMHDHMNVLGLLVRENGDYPEMQALLDDMGYSYFWESAAPSYEDAMTDAVEQLAQLTTIINSILQ